MIHLSDPRPPLPDGEERVLRELLRLTRVAGHEAERAEQASPLGVEEVLEGDRRHGR